MYIEPWGHDMKFLYNDLRISAKLIIGFSLVGILLLFGTMAGVSAAWFFKTRIDSLNNDYILPEQQVRMVVESVYRIDTAIAEALSGILTQSKAQDVVIRERADIDVIMKRMMENPEKSGENTSLNNAWLAYKSALVQVEIELKNDQKEELINNLKDGEFAQGQMELLKAAVVWRQIRSKIGEGYLENSNALFQWILVFLVGAGLVGIIISQLAGFVVTRSIIHPLRKISFQMGRISFGKSMERGLISQEMNRKDEMGGLIRDLDRVDEYIQSVAVLADKVASGDLSVNIRPRSEEDTLSLALTRMLDQLSKLVNQVAGSSQQVELASQQLVKAAGQTNLATGQITTTIHQVARGLNQQNIDINQAVEVMGTTTRAVDQVAQGTGEQESAVLQTIHEADQMATAIQQVTGNAQSVVKAAQDSSKKAEEGAGTLRKTVASMEIIRTQVGELAEKMNAVNTRSEEIGGIIETIEEIATKTNILAINATIEAAHAEVQSKKLTEDLLNQMMVSQCQMVNRIILSLKEDVSQDYWSSLSTSVGLDTILITDDDGVTVISSDPSLIGLRFSDDPKAQTHPFRKLIQQKNGVFCQEAQARTFDNRVFKYVGVSRADRPGIVQVGFNMESIRKFDLRINGFAVVASEVYQLAERARESTREIRGLVKGIQVSINEAVAAMQKSRKEVDAGMLHAGSAGAVLKEILEAVQGVSLQATQALTAAGAMEKLSNSLENEIRTFNRILEGNNSAVTALNNGYGIITRTMENTASVSEENSAAAEQVSASAEEMRSQMEEVASAAETLEKMSVDLNVIVSRFQLNGIH
jgi:methyl-accepting chemotaxis protein